MEKDLIFESFRRCITEPKCVGCKWETCGKIINGHPLRIPEVKIPVDLALAVVSLMADELYKKNNVSVELVKQLLRSGVSLDTDVDQEYVCGLVDEMANGGDGLTI